MRRDRAWHGGGSRTTTRALRAELAEAGSFVTHRRREMDSNHRSRVRRPIFECRLGLIPRRPKKSARKRTGTRRVGRIPAGPMVRIHLSPAVSQVRTCLSREFAFLRREATVFRGVQAGTSGAVGRDTQGAATSG